ncbi:MAG TPA: tRNA pseudouridine(55) synthase TruB [Candidatus Saccharimonadales bacterium]|nr:tRNA pseudouridine(55) synthase TruB [Candidatus Saccharimonadales bacterium]
MNGVLLVDKPAGWTSFDIVNKVRRLIQTSEYNVTHKKRFPVGHTGTLDPLATGLLVLLLGTYTKRAPRLTKLDKTYEVVLRLGQRSTTGDEEGEKTVVSDRCPTLEELHIALARFEGDTLQRPPAFSAIKINGQRAYKLARAGKTPELESRPVHIERIILTKYDYPDVHFTTHVGSGTYIRSLVEDIGTALGTGAYMAHLRRTRVGAFRIEDALPIADVSLEAITERIKTIEGKTENV